MPRVAGGFSTKKLAELVSAYTADPTPREIQYFETLQDAGRSLVFYMSYGGSRTWRVLFYDGGKPRTRAIGSYADTSLAEARKRAREFPVSKTIASANAGNFEEIAEDWLKRHVDKEGLRTSYEIRRQLARYILPAWRGVNIFEIGRNRVNDLLDKIEDENSAGMADYVLSTVRSIMTWYAVRNGDYNSPIVPKMDRKKKISRDRVLRDEELAAIWEACADLGAYGAMVKILLLTAQRLDKVAAMRWADICSGVKFRDTQKRDREADNVWIVRTESGEKGNIGAVQLPRQALEVLGELHRLEDQPYIFPAAKGHGHINSFSRWKTDLDAKLDGIEPWRLHDLRRTARTRMAEIGIDDNIAERTLGHAIQGVHGIYNRFSYFDQKSEALRKLGNHIERIVDPSVEASKVVALRK